jgi:hypothetical protein
MAITCADDLKLVTGANVDDAHPHGDLDRIAYGDGGGSSASASPLRGYPIVCAMEEALWRVPYNFMPSYRIRGTAYDHGTKKSVEFSRAVKAFSMKAVKNSFDYISSCNGLCVDFSKLSMSPKVASSNRFRVEYASCIVSSFPHETMALPAKGDCLTTDYLAALQQSLASFDAVADMNDVFGVSFSSQDTVRYSESSENFTPSDIPYGIFGYYSYSNTINKKDSKYSCFYGISPSLEVIALVLRDGAPIQSVVFVLRVSISQSIRDLDMDTTTSTSKSVWFPVSVDADKPVLSGAVFDEEFVRTVCGLAGIGFDTPTRGTNTIDISLTPTIVVQFKAL